MELEFAPRFNIITGDNGLGKSFLLDVIWWVLTRTWPQQVNSGMGAGYMAEPRDPAETAAITAWVEDPGRNAEFEVTYTYRPPEESWVPESGSSDGGTGPREEFGSSGLDPSWVPASSAGNISVRPDRPIKPYRLDFTQPFATSLVVYAHADGSFSSWDPHRHAPSSDGGRHHKRPALVLTPDEVLNGAWVRKGGRTVYLCNGLIRDWANWSAAKDRDHERMMEVLNALAADASVGPIDVGEPTRVSFSDSRDIPTILTRYAGPVPILHASAGVRRVASIAYILALTWREHRLAAQRLGGETCKRIVLLVDEVESHLHPRWQRLILLSLQAAVDAMAELDMQVVATTHSPLVMSAAERFFDGGMDRWFDLVLHEGSDSDGKTQLVELRTPSFERLGTVGHWLESAEAFALPTDRGNTEAERLILKARDLLVRGDVRLKEIETLNDKLAEQLEVNDPFLARWGYFVEQVKRRRRADGK